MTNHPSLQRFVLAQDGDATYARALAELRAGRKQSHWMWFVFPQIAGLGRSEMSRRYAIQTQAEAKAYVEHPVLGARLRECAQAVLAAGAADAQSIFGPIDATKLRSSMTLFMRVAPDEPLFAEVIRRFFDGRPDAATDERLASIGA